MANLLGVLLGAEIERSEGGSGVKGAIEGFLIEGAVRAILPLATTFAIGWGVQFVARRAFEAIAGRDVNEAPATN